MEVFQPVNIVPGLTVFGLTFITMTLFPDTFVHITLETTGFHSEVFYPCNANDCNHNSELPCYRTFSRSALFGQTPLHISFLYSLCAFLGFFFGIFLGITCRETQVLALGNIYIISSTLLGGAWMDLRILGETIEKITDLLPFSHAIEASRIVLSGRQDDTWVHLGVACLYALVFFMLAVVFFRRKMRSDNK